MKVRIDCDKRVKHRGSKEYVGGWYYQESLPNERYEEYTEDFPPRSRRVATYAEAKAMAIADGHEVNTGGWKRRLLSWNWTSHALDGYPGWERDEDPGNGYQPGHPFFVKLTHTRVEGKDVESSVLANAWDDIAEADFYQRDWTDDGIPFVRDGETYWSGWWFATKAERDRFVAWQKERA